MKKIIFNLLGLILGLVIGSFANGMIVNLGHSVFPLPAGTDLNSMEGFTEAVKLFTWKDYIFPFLAHALGTFLAAIIAVRIAQSHHGLWASIIGGLFFLGGLYMVLILPAPFWFNVTDLLLAYFPMAYLGYRWGKRA